MRTGILDSPPPPFDIMEFLNWDFADTPAGDAAYEQNWAHEDGNPEGTP